MSKSKKSNTIKARVGSMMPDSLFYDQRTEKLSKEAFILLIEALMLFNGYNNGDLALTNGTLRLNWRKQTLIDKRQELLDAEFIHMEKRGYFGKPNLYSLSHMPVSDLAHKGIVKTSNARRRATGVHPKKRRVTEV